MFSVPYNPIEIPTNPIGGTNISQLSSLKIGAGGEVMSVDNAGNANFGGDISAATGTFENALYVGDSKVILDGTDGSFKIKDTSGNVIIYLGL